MQYWMHMVQRHFWQKLIEQAWRQRSVVWLAGVRRVGKTFLCQSLHNVEYFDCELPRTRRVMEDPQAFLDGLGGRRIVLEEIHRLPNPSESLKIAADHHPGIRVLATGSSTLGASAKFKDTLAGRKRNVWLTPMCLEDLKDARRPDLRHRFLRGGLPPFFLAESFPEHDFQEWMGAYWDDLSPTSVLAIPVHQHSRRIRASERRFQAVLRAIVLLPREYGRLLAITPTLFPVCVHEDIKPPCRPPRWRRSPRGSRFMHF